MQQPKHHVSFIKSWQQLVVVVVAAFIVPIAVIVILAQYATDSPEEAKKDPSAVLSRIKPVGEYVLASAMPAPAAAAAPAQVAAATPVAAGGKPDGKKIYDVTCIACHSTGAAGAPKFGDKAAWGPRLAHGVDALYTVALKGKGAMPPKGGNASLSDADIKAAVDYLAASAK